MTGTGGGVAAWAFGFASQEYAAAATTAAATNPAIVKTIVRDLLPCINAVIAFSLPCSGLRRKPHPAYLLLL